jgi:6-pyruvoyltetrahydropterin/6-carboxytetrahydropterin synthase
MIQVTRSIEWDMGHRVPNHKHKCRYPHGHRYRLELTLSGQVSHDRGTSHEGMVHDFGDIKQILLDKIHDTLDHCFMASEDDVVFTPLAKEHDLQILLVPFIPTAENIVQWCFDRLQHCFPSSLKITRLRLYETPTSWADFIPDNL